MTKITPYLSTPPKNNAFLQSLNSYEQSAIKKRPSSKRENAGYNKTLVRNTLITGALGLSLTLGAYLFGVKKFQTNILPKLKEYYQGFEQFNNCTNAKLKIPAALGIKHKVLDVVTLLSNKASEVTTAINSYFQNNSGRSLAIKVGAGVVAGGTVMAVGLGTIGKSTFEAVKGVHQELKSWFTPDPDKPNKIRNNTLKLAAGILGLTGAGIGLYHLVKSGNITKSKDLISAAADDVQPVVQEVRQKATSVAEKTVTQGVPVTVPVQKTIETVIEEGYKNEEKAINWLAQAIKDGKNREKLAFQWLGRHLHR